MATAHTTNLPTHRDDVASYLEHCADVFGQLAALAKVIESQAPDYSDLKKLAGAARYLADDSENTVGYWHDEITENGVRND